MCGQWGNMEGSVGQMGEKLKENWEGIKTGRIKDTNTWKIEKDWKQLVSDVEGMGTQDYQQQLHDSWQKGVKGNIFNKQAWKMGAVGGGGNPFDDDTDDATTTITDTSTDTSTGSGTTSGRDALDPAMLRIMNKMGKTDTKREMLTKTARKGPGLRI